MLHSSSDSVCYDQFFSRGRSAEAFGSLRKVPTTQFFQIPASKKSLQNFLKLYFESNLERLETLTISDVYNAAESRGYQKELKNLGRDYANELIESEIAVYRLRHLEIEGPLDLDDLKPLKHDPPFENVSILSRKIAELYLKRGASRKLLSERSELEALRLMTEGETQFDILRVLLYDYRHFFMTQLTLPPGCYTYGFYEERSVTVEPEALVGRLFNHYHPFGEEAFVRDIPEKRFEVSHPALAEKSVDDAKIDSLIKSLKSDSYHQALEELAERLDRGATLKDKSFRITTDGGKLVFTYSPAFVLKVYDHEEEVFSVKVLFRVSGISTTMSSLPRFEFFCRMSDLCRSPDVSESKYLQGINALYQLMLEWKVKGERHPFTNKSPSEPGTTFRLDLDKTVKSGFFSSFGSPKGLLASPKKVKKTQSANLPKKTSTGKFELLKATKSATALKKFSSNKKSLKDFEKDVDRYLPTFLGSIPSEKDMVAEMISEAIPGYQVYHSSPRKIGERYQRLLAREAERVLGYYPLSRELVRTVFNFCYAPPHDKRFNTMYSLSRSRLLKNGDFQSKILSKDIRIRMLGRCHYGHSQTTTMRMVCAKIFFHVYAGGFRDHHLMNAEDDQDMELISELQARRFLAMIPSRIHWYVYPYLEGMSVQGITAEFTNLFPNLNQTEEALDSSCSNGSGEDVDKNYSLTSRLAGKKPKIFATHNHDTFVLHHDYTFLFYRFGAKRPVGQLVFSHRVIHKLGQGKCLRFYKIQNLSFAKGIDLKIAEYIIGEIQHCALVQSTV